MARAKTKQFTKEDVRKVASLWNTKTLAEIADDLGWTVEQVSYLAYQMRKAGVDLPRKKQQRRGLQQLIHLMLEEGELSPRR